MATYSVKFKCMNCSFIFTREIEKGVSALGRAGECPSCGCNQDTAGTNGQKIGVFPIETEDLKKSTLQLLLEEFGVITPKQE